MVFHSKCMFYSTGVNCDCLVNTMYRYLMCEWKTSGGDTRISWQYTWRKHPSLPDVTRTRSAELSLFTPHPQWYFSQRRRNLTILMNSLFIWQNHLLYLFGARGKCGGRCWFPSLLWNAQGQWWEAVWGGAGWMDKGVPRAQQGAKSAEVRGWNTFDWAGFDWAYLCRCMKITPYIQQWE